MIIYFDILYKGPFFENELNKNKYMQIQYIKIIEAAKGNTSTCSSMFEMLLKYNC